MGENGLSDDRERVADAVVKILTEEGPKTTSELRDDLYEDFEHIYDTKSSFHRTLNYIREDMEEE